LRNTGGSDMSVELTHSPVPDDFAAKQEELERLEQELLQTEEELNTLRRELRAFESEYVRVVGVWFARLAEIEARIAELLALQNPTDPAAQESFNQARNRANESARETTEEQARPLESTFIPSPDLKKLWRDMAKRMHPDTGPEEERDRRTKFLQELNNAYETGDEVRMKEVFAEFMADAREDPDDGFAAKLDRVVQKIVQIQRRIASNSTAIAALRQSPIFELRERANQEKAEGRNLLSDMVLDVQLEIGVKAKLLQDLERKLSAPPVDPSSAVTVTAPPPSSKLPREEA